MSSTDTLKRAVAAIASARWLDVIEMWSDDDIRRRYKAFADAAVAIAGPKVGFVDQSLELLQKLGRTSEVLESLKASRIRLEQLASRRTDQEQLKSSTNGSTGPLSLANNLLKCRRLDEARTLLEARLNGGRKLEYRTRLAKVAVWQGRWEEAASLVDDELITDFELKGSVRRGIARATKIAGMNERDLLDAFQGVPLVREIKRVSAHEARELRRDLQALEHDLLALDPGTSLETSDVAVAIPDGALDESSLKNSSVVEGASSARRSSMNVAAAPVLKETGIDKLAYQTKDYKYLRASRSERHLSIEVSEEGEWTRFLLALESTDLPAPGTTQRIDILLNSPSTVTKNGAISLCHFVGKELVRLTALGAIPAKDISNYNRVTVYLDEENMELARSLTGSTVYVVLTFFGKVSLRLSRTSIKTSADRGGLAPYCFTNSQRYTALVYTNGALARAESRGLGSWLTEQARVACRLDCVETAEACLLHVIASPDLLRKTRISTLLTVSTNTFLSTGNYLVLLKLLLDNISEVRKSDLLVLALETCLSKLSLSFSPVATLPSGVPSLSSLARPPLRVDEILSSGDSALSRDETLAVASKLLPISESSYLQLLNAYLSKFKLSPLSLTQSQSPILISRFRASDPVCSANSRGPMVSVIMSAFEAAQTIEYSAASILRQSYNDIELLICDDDSSDETMEKIRKLACDPRVRVFRSASNQGTYNIRNGLMAAARGELITFQDSDDFSHPERISKQVSSLQAGGLVAIMSSWIRMRASGEVVFFSDNRGLRVSTVSLMFRRKIIESIGLYHSVACGADTDYLERIRMRYGDARFGHLEEPLLLGLWSDQSLTRQATMLATEDHFKSPQRRVLGEAMARARILGSCGAPREEVHHLAQDVELWRTPAELVEVPSV